MDPLNYLAEDFDPVTFTVAQLRSVLVEHQIKYPSNALKSALIATFNKEITPNRTTILEKYNAQLQVPINSSVPAKRTSDDDDSDFIDHSMASLDSNSNSEQRPRKRKQKKSIPKVSTPPAGSYLNLETLEMDENDDILNLTIDQVQTPMKSTIKKHSPLIDASPLNTFTSKNNTPLSGPKKPLNDLVSISKESSIIIDLNSSDDEEIERVIEKVDEIEKELANQSSHSFDEVEYIDISLDEDTDFEDENKKVVEAVEEEIKIESKITPESLISSPIKQKIEPIIKLNIPTEPQIQKVAPSSTKFAKLVKYLSISMLLTSIGISTVGFFKFAEIKNQRGYCSTSSLSPLNNPSFHQFQPPVKFSDSLPTSYKGFDLKIPNQFLSNMESTFWDFSSQYLNCEPCPSNGKCSLNSEIKCNPGFMESHTLAHYLSFGTIPQSLTTTCEVDTITPLKLEFIREYSHNLLHKKEDGLMSLGELHDLLKASSGTNMDNAKFEEYWALYLKTELGILNPLDASTSKLEISISMLNTSDKITHVIPTQFKDHQLPTGNERRKKRSIFKYSTDI